MRYELVFVLRKMSKKNVETTLKRIADTVWDKNGVLRKIEYLGIKELPMSVRSQTLGKPYRVGNYFIYHLEIGTPKLHELRKDFKLDLDIVKSTIYPKDKDIIPDGYECTLEDELLPPSLRPSVKPLLDHKNVVTDRVKTW